MIISHKYKFIFIKTRKTAGTSIEVFLSQCCGADDVVTPVRPHVEPHKARNYRGLWNPVPELIEYRGHETRRILKGMTRRMKFYDHISSRSVKRRIPGEIWNGYFKFCVERNPWDKTMSHYHMINAREGGTVSFDEYIERRSFCVDYPRYTDADGRLMVDRVIRYESLAGELAQVFGRLGIPFNGTLSVRAKADLRKDRTPYQEVFTAAQRRVIADAFSKEIEMHGYRF